MRICSLLPSATEILYAIGAGDSVVGVTHECDFPPEAAAKPALIRPRVDVKASAAEIDRQVSELVERGESIYSVDGDLLQSILPDLIVTQDLCHVCAASPDDLASALAGLRTKPRVLSLTPRSLDDVWDDVRRIGEATGRSAEADALAINLAARVASVEERLASVRLRPRVLCLEWLDPFYVGGHWVPEMIAKAGGEDVLGRAAEPSFRVTADEIAASSAEVILVAQCGYGAGRNAADFNGLRSSKKWPQAWNALPGIRESRIYAVDANSYFSRPGPRLAEGVALLAHILHPEVIPFDFPAGACRRLDSSAKAAR